MWNPFWGTVVLLNGRSTLLPGADGNELVSANRGGNLIDGFRKIGGGALIIAHAPKSVKANAQKKGFLEPDPGDTFTRFSPEVS